MFFHKFQNIFLDFIVNHQLIHVRYNIAIVPIHIAEINLRWFLNRNARFFTLKLGSLENLFTLSNLYMTYNFYRQILLDTKILSLSFLNPIFLRSKWRMVLWLRDFFLATFNFPAGADTFRHQNHVLLIQGVPKGMDIFQSLIIKKLDNLRKFFLYHQSQYRMPLFRTILVKLWT